MLRELRRVEWAKRGFPISLICRAPNSQLTYVNSWRHFRGVAWHNGMWFYWAKDLRTMTHELHSVLWRFSTTVREKNTEKLTNTHIHTDSHYQTQTAACHRTHRIEVSKVFDIASPCLWNLSLDLLATKRPRNTACLRTGLRRRWTSRAVKDNDPAGLRSSSRRDGILWQRAGRLTAYFRK